ncbi:MAG: hypothetical protein HPY52_10660 [Firmicutes bacterium]|nr:hypothetical protein [Bacillota bacterium]
MKFFANDYAVVNLEQSQCGDCVHIKICPFLRDVDDLQDVFVRREVTIQKCGAYMSISQIKEAKDDAREGATA